MRFNTYFRLFPEDQLLNFTVYGEYEDLNQAALYKMEVSGFGVGDLTLPLAVARHAPDHTFEQRAIVYHDWGRTNLTFNLISETGLSHPANDFGYAVGVFRQPASMPMPGMTGMSRPPAASLQRLGFGLEMIGALGNNRQFGFDWPRQQQYLGSVFSYSLSRNWIARLEPAFGLSRVSDPFVLRMGVTYSMESFVRPLSRVF